MEDVEASARSSTSPPAGRVVGSRSLRMSCPARPRPVRHKWTRRHRISHGALVDSIGAAGKCGQQEQGGLQNPKGNQAAAAAERHDRRFVL